MPLIFGLDIGTTSIGFAAIDYDAERDSGHIIRLGTRIFPEARDPKGTPLNQTRRQKRLMRRQLRRRKQRRRELNTLLADLALLPPFRSAAWAAVMRMSNDNDPYTLRVRGLTEKLEPFELGRAIYHLAKRRHFKGRDAVEGEEKAAGTETDADEAKKEKAAQSEREMTLVHLKDTGQTLGQWLAGRGPHERRRVVHAIRAVVADELDRLLAKQAEHHPVLRDPSTLERLKDTILYQRPVFWRFNTLGSCRLDREAEPAPRASWASQQKRMLEKLNNLALAGGNARPLDAEERRAILEVLQSRPSMTWAQVRKSLEPIWKAQGHDPKSLKQQKFNLEYGGERSIPGNLVEAKLAEIFATKWNDRTDRDRLRRLAPELWWTASYTRLGQRVVVRPEGERRQAREENARRYASEFSIAPDKARSLAEITLPPGWDAYSEAALEKVLPRLEEGHRFGALMTGPEWEDWRNRTFPSRVAATGEVLDRLPSPGNADEQKRLSSLRNPTVVRVSNELRKVVNNLINFCGRKPDLIRIELAREVGLSKREREERQTGIDKNERRRRDAKKDLQGNGILEPSREDIEKWLLWDECGRFDPYSGKPICFDDLFRNNVFQVEHIWPRPISGDNSFANKTLCHRDFNARKGNRTPFQAFGHDADWDAMKQRMWERVNARAMSKRKAERFCSDQPIPEDFASRQLNDTGWAARAAMAQLKRLWPDVGPEAPVTVQAVSGRVTGHLRRLWGLNNVLAEDGEKTRADHRHHAIDALVVACTHPGITQRLSRYWQAKDQDHVREPPLDPPWRTIRADAEKAVAEVVVSHRVRKKVSGALHKETTYRDTERNASMHNEATVNGKYRVFATRIPVEKLAANCLLETPPPREKYRVVDDRVRETLRAWVAKHGGEPKKAFAAYPRLTPDGPEIRKVRVHIKQQLELMARLNPRIKGYADLGDNHHVAIWQNADGSLGYRVTSLLEAARRLARREPIVQCPKDARRVMSLAKGETIDIPDGEKKGLWVVTGAWANGQIVLDRIQDAIGNTTWRPNPNTLLSRGAKKVAVDPIGRVRPAND
jgi:CRISPR-associated endonuclease Csn1